MNQQAEGQIHSETKREVDSKVMKIILAQCCISLNAESQNTSAIPTAQAISDTLSFFAMCGSVLIFMFFQVYGELKPAGRSGQSKTHTNNRWIA